MRLLPALEWLLLPRARAAAGLRDYLQINKATRLPLRTLTVNSPLLGEQLVLRAGTSDASVFLETFVGRFHLPPAGSNPRVIYDIGANIGLTSAHYAVLFPAARIVAIEPQHSLAIAARGHTAKWSDRVSVIEAACWTMDSRLDFSVSQGFEYGGHIGPGEDELFQVDALSLNTLLSTESRVDFLKLDIEGAEESVLLENTEWAVKVGCIQVECHHEFTVQRCIEALTRLGFRAIADTRHWSSVTGERPRHIQDHKPS